MTNEEKILALIKRVKVLEKALNASCEAIWLHSRAFREAYSSSEEIKNRFIAGAEAEIEKEEQA